ncbi:GNAT family N-acetyltransferase [Roseobacter sp. CCS2]|uniref:GNAT family N-acetyltransferase n=1 Tax=Roseobacter sp. CCS2 TaxID=391593 RepID=UPI0000F3E023|nr:GNAT family N-acetyltransferase [Roseobacter sp. CCS2]EBA12346.1 acetyltransferase, GNAT family protein [Roseobacter sp. CCS2]
MIPTLQTERLTLRAPRWDDFEAYAVFRASPRMVTTGGPFTRDQAFAQLSAILGHWVLRGYGRWMVADRERDAPLGIVGLYFPEGWPEPELAWSLFDTAEGRGIAHEAAVAARQYAYDALEWTTLISAVDPNNTRSVALAKRMGCVQEDSFQHETYGVLHIWRHPAPEVPA